MKDPHTYWSLVGALQYVPLTKPEIAYSVNKLCQFFSNLLETHWCAAKMVLQYLSGLLPMAYYFNQIKWTTSSLLVSTTTRAGKMTQMIEDQHPDRVL